MVLKLMIHCKHIQYLETIKEGLSYNFYSILIDGEKWYYCQLHADAWETATTKVYNAMYRNIYQVDYDIPFDKSDPKSSVGRVLKLALLND